MIFYESVFFVLLGCVTQQKILPQIQILHAQGENEAYDDLNLVFQRN